jgi:septum formation protein
VTTLNPIILASASSTRAEMLRAVGVTFVIDTADIDEPQIRATMVTSDPAKVAVVLAHKKAAVVCDRHRGSLVIGADQILNFNGALLGKPGDRDDARTQLKELRGHTHQLVTSVCVAQNSEILWQHTNQANLAMRNFSDGFLENYLDREERALDSPGAYHLETLGAGLFNAVDGDHFSILGLPLLPLLEFLRGRGAIQA